MRVPYRAVRRNAARAQAKIAGISFPKFWHEHGERYVRGVEAEGKSKVKKSFWKRLWDEDLPYA